MIHCWCMHLVMDGGECTVPPIGCVPIIPIRVCPGRHLVDSMLWILVVSVLASFSVRKKVDMSGNEIPVEGVYKDALISWV